MLFTEKGELRSESRSSREQFLRDWNWSTAEDLCHDLWRPDEHPYTWPKEVPARAISDTYIELATMYIRACTVKYPFQMRQYLGEPMWMRFCESWSSTGSFAKAMRAI